MRSNYFQQTLKAAVLAVTVLLLGVGASLAQQQVNLTAGPATLTMPDGSVVPMWGYSCGTAVSGATATCAKSNPAATGWSPVVITVPTGQGLTINLTDSLTFTPTGATTPNTVPTSLVIVGQAGGGLGTTATSVPSPDHSQAQAATTWPIAGGPGGTPPPQGLRVQSFSTEVAAGATTALTWTTPSAGTYLLESGTHPSIQGPMGLYGMVVVTSVPAGAVAGTAYGTAGTASAISYNAEIPVLFSEIDPVQNTSVDAAVRTAGFSETAVWSGQPSGCGNPTSATYHTCYPPAVNYSPLYYLINGVAFDKTNATASLIPASPATGVTGSVLVRMVNAGLRMHVPSIVGSQTGSAAPGFGLIAEDGNPLPGVTRVQSEVFLAPGKTYDVMINAPAAGGTALPIFDRELSLSGNKTARDAGMLAYLSVNGAALPTALTTGVTATANPDTYNSVIAGQTLTVSDPGKGVIANDINVYGVKVVGTAPAGLTLNPDGTFTYTAGVPTSFTYCGNGAASGPACTTATLAAAPMEAASGITCTGPILFSSNSATFLNVRSPGVLSSCKDAAGYPLTVNAASVTPTSGLTVKAGKSGGFLASASAAGTYTFSFKPQNSQGTLSSATMTATVIFPTATGLSVTLLDGGDKKTAYTDYRWIIEEDRTFYVDPTKTTNTSSCTPTPPATTCTTGTTELTFGTNFHTSYMPVVAQGCTGPLSCENGQSVGGVPAACDFGSGVCDTTATQQTAVSPASVHLDPTKRYYISVLPGDAATPFNTANASPGHGMGGAPIGVGQTAVTIYAQPTPLHPSKLSVFVFEDDYPLNGENDAGGGALGTAADGLAANEPGLGHFNITLFDDAGGTGDATGQMTYDMFNMPLSNSLSGTIDPATGHNACPISQGALQTGPDSAPVVSPTGITGTIVTCPRFEDDGVTFSPLAGQVVVANLMPGRYGVVATPGADLIAAGEEWLQTNTLDGQKAHDSFLRVGEPSYFQEFGPAGYHVSIGFANPKIINDRLAGVCAGTLISPVPPGTSCNNTVLGHVSTERMSRTPDERLYGSGDYSSFSFTQCYVSLGDPDGADFALTKCDANGNFQLGHIPSGNWRVTVFDQWNDMLVDGLSSPVGLGANLAATTTNPGVTVIASPCPGAGTIKSGTTVTTCDLGEVATNQWQANIYTSTFFDVDGKHVRGSSNPGLSLVPTNIRFRDGSYSNFNNTDLNGNAGFNEVFPLFSWYVVESDTTRYKNTGTHVVYDAGGPADGSSACGQLGYPACGTAQGFLNMANTAEPAAIALPAVQHVPGAQYCADADCTGAMTGGSTGRIDPPWVKTEGWQGFSGQNSFLEFGKTPYLAGENGGIHGEVIYASTRPFDDPALLIHTSWTPDVPNVTINLYQEGTAPDGSISLKLVDTTKTSSFDDWAQGFRPDGNPNMNCPGQYTAPTSTTPGDLFFFTLYNQPMYLDVYNNAHAGTQLHTIPANSQFKCYDGMHNWNQLQPAPYDGKYEFPSIAGRNPTTGLPTGGAGSVTGTNCTVCVFNPTDNTPMLPVGKYVVEMVTPPGYELVKEEDKNILIGDNYIAPVTQQFGGLGNIFILPDQAEVASAYNANNPQNPTSGLGRTTFPSKEGDTGSVETFWPCVGEMRTVPDFISLFPQSAEVSPFAGATRPLCDRKEVTLGDQESELAKFWVFTSTHVAAHFTGVITDDFTSEFDPFAPQFGEKFAPPNMPIAIKDWSGTEISRVYTDQWGAYNGLTYSTWEVNPPNPTGYAPTMMVTCMNDPGTGPSPDPLYNPQYSNFCYEIPFMPGQTQYMDTPVTPTSAFAGAGYNNPDCAYPDATPAIKEVDGDGVGPWVSGSGGANARHSFTITALGDQTVPNNAYSGPVATTAPFNAKTITRHYGFGATQGSVTIGGVSAPISLWSDSSITVTAPSGVPMCTTQQQSFYSLNASDAHCGQLVITAANGKQSIDAITLTIGGKAPTHVAATESIQAAIDAAKPGDLIIVDPTCTTTTGPVACTGPATTTVTHGNATHQELVQMWKPVRLQGVGAASSIINANTHPAGKLDAWRRQIDCLFGLSIDATPIAHHPAGTNQFDPSGTFTCSSAMNFAVDRLPLEATVGWDASLNGNLAEQLQEPSLMGAYEGAGITVLGKGVKFPGGSDPFGSDVFPVGTLLLSRSDCGGNSGTNPYPSNFYCNPSSIDGLGITNSSQGGGGIFVHAWAHNLQIANNRVYNNSGTLAGGIAVGQGEFPGQYLKNPTTPNADPGSCQNNGETGTQLPYCFNWQVNVHNNMVALNSSLGDELFSSTNSGAGGVAFCTGADYYQFNNNWVCGNLSTGDGGGLIHLGFIYNGDIEHNNILFNQSTNPTVPTNGGGIAVLGAPDTDPTCGVEPDQDCPPGTSDGTGPNLKINANLIMGNSADSGSGGGIRFHQVNGTEITFFPKGPSHWYSVNVTNNIITNNVAGWDGAGVSLQDAVAVNLINNTIMSNDTTASSGVLFNTLGAPLSSSPNPGPTAGASGTTSLPQPAGLVAISHSPTFLINLSGLGTLTCPSTPFPHPNCGSVSYPYMANDIFWQNRSFYIGVGSAVDPAHQQFIVSLFNESGTAAANQTATGVCPTASYWDLGVRGDASPSTRGAITLAPTYSIVTDVTDYPGLNNSGSNPTVVSQYCNGSRIPPEFGGTGWQVPPGIADANVPNPPFTLTPAATVDEGNNWVNLSWGPLAMTNPVTSVVLGNYALNTGSPAIDYIPFAGPTGVLAFVAPATDFFGHARPATPGTNIDVGAVEFAGGTANPTLVSIVPNVGPRGYMVNVTLNGTNLSGVTAINVQGADITVSNLTVVNATQVTATFAIAGTAATGARTVSVSAGAVTSNTVTFNIANPPPSTLTSIAPNTGSRGATVPVTLTGTSLFTTTAVNVSGNGVTVTNVVIVSDTSVTANLAIAAGATVNTRNVSVTTLGGGSNSVAFTITGPTVTAITPTSGVRGATVPVSITGTGLAGATGVTMGGGGGGVACTIVGTPTATTVNASCVIARGAGLTTRNVRVVTPIGTTPTNTSVTFTVTGAGATFAGPTPALTTVPANTTTKSSTVTVTNPATSTGPLTLTAAPAIAKVGGAGGTFSITGGTCASGSVLPPGASCTIAVQYVPGSSTATASANVSVTGTGLGGSGTATSNPNFTAN